MRRLRVSAPPRSSGTDAGAVVPTPTNPLDGRSPPGGRPSRRLGPLSPLGPLSLQGRPLAAGRLRTDHACSGREATAVRRTWEAGAMPVTVDDATFDAAVGDALDDVPQELMALLDNVVFLVEDEPPEDLGDLLGLYEGTPLTERGWGLGGMLPDRIYLYRGPLSRLCEDLEDLRVHRVGDLQPHGRGHRDGRARDRPSLRHRRRASPRDGLGLTGGVCRGHPGRMPGAHPAPRFSAGRSAAATAARSTARPRCPRWA